MSVNYGQDIKIACDVIIGTIPLREAFMAAPGYSAVISQPLPMSLPEPSMPLPPPPPGPPPPGFFDYSDIRKYYYGYDFPISHHLVSLQHYSKQ